jgi:hypothetical protein
MYSRRLINCLGGLNTGLSNTTNSIGNITTTGGNVGIGINNPLSLLHVNGILSTTTITTENVNTNFASIGTLSSTNISSASIISSNISAGTLTFTNVSAGSGTATIGTIRANNISVSNLIFTSLSAGSGSATIGSVIASNISAGALTFTNLSAGSSNATIGNIVSTKIETTDQTINNSLLIINNSLNPNFQIRSSGTNQYMDIGAESSGERRFYIYGYGSYPLMFGTNGTERIRILNSGNVGIGTANPSEPLDVNGTIRCLNIRAGSFINTNPAQSGLLTDRIAFGPEVSNFYVINHDGNYNYSAGVRLQNGSMSWASQSDIRYKRDITPLDYDLTHIIKLNPVKFNYIFEKLDRKKNLGFIAQEVKKIIPELVVGEETDTDSLAIEEVRFIPILVKAIQQLNEENNKIKTFLKSKFSDF